jgi:FkbM family methyltransferase
MEVPLRYHYRRLAGELEREQFLLASMVRPDSVAVDVGAAVGTYSYPLAKLCRIVEAFEPFPEQSPGLAAIRGVRLHPVALSDQEGTLTMYVPLWGGQPFFSNSTSQEIEGPSRAVTVQAAPLDSFELDAVSFIKIDAEGHEELVLNGASATLARCRPNLLIEIEQRHLRKPIDEVLRHVLSFGYRGYFMAGDQLQPLARFDVEQHQHAHLENRSGPAYVANFVFLPTSNRKRLLPAVQTDDPDRRSTREGVV